MLHIVSSNPVVESVVLLETLVINILEVDCVLIEHVTGLWEALIHKGQIVILLFIYHKLNLFVGHK